MERRSGPRDAAQGAAPLDAPSPETARQNAGYDEATELGPPGEAEISDAALGIGGGDTVDGDFNGAPELAGIEESQGWEGVDTLDALRGREARDANLSPHSPARVLYEERLLQRRAETIEALESIVPGMSGEAAAGSAADSGAPPSRSAELDAAAASGMGGADEASAVGTDDDVTGAEGDATLQEAEVVLRQQLRRIDLALDRLESGEYGACLECGQPIDMALLDAEPERLQCERCQRRAHDAERSIDEIVSLLEGESRS